ncbi:AAA family ATPase [Kitasatospora sp. NBC_01250]|uniref:helix-turn-helix transcriptional regulator n=1 Tax=unclassified Kitasatospora TaxID=2633591 RepID=UPI002E107AC3|nr:MULTISPECIES: AAA family ATPase [unclassified Kitasatospora]WSJ65959.1 AAA family ATPase [Kitasatospora sp. NBC_01302]
MTGRPDLIERTEELLVLNSITTAALQGAGSVGLVVGPVASGKSVLLSALGEQAGAAGATVLRATGAQAEAGTPLSIVGQLLHQAPLDADGAVRTRHLLAVAARATGPDQLPADLVQALCGVLFDLSKTIPLLICVDDAHHADPFSLQWLLFLIRRLGTARIAVVLTERTARQHPRPAFHAELLRQPHCRRIMLGPLSHEGVVHLLGTRLETERAAELAPRVDALTGGNPLLVHGLLEDLRSSTRHSLDQYPAGLGDGFAFSQAVVSCLHRSEPAALAVARGIAVLGDQASDHLLGQLLGLFPSLVAGVIDGLHSAGLLEDGRFRHPAVRTAVLHDTDAAELSALHTQAARLLYGQGAPERAIAEQLLASDRPGEGWSTRVLCDVARQALFDGDADLARRSVEHAHRGCTDPRERAKVLTLLAGVEWQLQPGSATRHLPMLTAALRAGELDDRDSVVVVKYLLRHGRITEATHLLEHLLTLGRPIDARTASEVQTVKLQFSSSYPGALAELRPFGSCNVNQDRTPAAVRADPQLQAAAALDEVLSGRADENTFLGAEQVLRSIGLTYRHWEQVEFALLALVYGDQLERAAFCCEQLLGRVGRAAEGIRPPLLALRGLIAVRQGRLVDAERYATSALEQLPWNAWGVNIGLPLATLLMTYTLMGKYEDAAQLLNRPVPQAIYQTRYGMHYLFARGEFRLATNHPHAALDDFLICGEMMQDWDLDLPSVVSWRSAAARVHLQMGNHQQAKVLIDEQTKRLQPGPSRSRGLTMRLSAAVAELKYRPSLLRQAVDDLQRCGSRVELALALADLGYAHQNLGDHKRSRIMMSRAWQLAKEQSAEPIQRGLSSMFSELREEVAPAPATEVATAEAAGSTASATDGLSDAERRVAGLAALGHSNREIARELFITVSTVEQHLTRVYRKLKVTRRSDLPSDLCLVTSGSAWYAS